MIPRSVARSSSSRSSPPAGGARGLRHGRASDCPGLALGAPVAYAFAAFMALANVVMEYALLSHDFSVSYVAHVGSRSVPTWVSMVSLWSSLEARSSSGSGDGRVRRVATWQNRDKHPEYMPYAVGVWLACGASSASSWRGRRSRSPPSPARPWMARARTRCCRTTI